MEAIEQVSYLVLIVSAGVRRAIPQRDSQSPLISLRSSGTMMVPYIEVDLVKPDVPFPVVEISVGPGPHSELSGRGVKAFLTNYNRGELNHIEVFMSDIPYRNW